MSEHGFQMRLLHAWDEALGVDAVMQHLPAQVDPGQHGRMPVADRERLVRAITRHATPVSVPLDLVRAHRSRRKRRRIGAVAISLLLAAAAAQWRWGGRDPTHTLEFDESFQILFDESYSLTERHSAHGRIYICLRNAIRAFHAASLRPGTRDAAMRALEATGRLLDAPVPADFEAGLRGEALEDLAKRLTDGDATPATVSELMDRVRLGIHALQLASALVPGFRQSTEIAFGHLRRELQQ